MVQQLQDAQQVQLARLVQAARAQLRTSEPGQAPPRTAEDQNLDHPHLRQLLHLLLQDPGHLQDPIRPVQDVLVHLPPQDTFHPVLFRFDARHRFIHAGPEGADLVGRVTGLRNPGPL